jgi:FkbM family methyltransferase
MGPRKIFVYPSGRLSSFHEKTVIEDVLDELNADDVFYDIGANFGRYACTIGVVKPDVQVVAIEPHPKNFEILQSNFKRNRINADTLECALSKQSGKMRLQEEDHPARHNLTTSGNEGVLVDVKTGDEIIEENLSPKPDVIKIDVEGAEFDVLKGLERTLSRGVCRVVYIELHPFALGRFETTTEEIESFLFEKGFSVDSIHQRKVTGPHDDEEQEQIFLKATRESSR